MIIPAAICSSSTAATTRKYFPVLRWLGVSGRNLTSVESIGRPSGELVNEQDPTETKEGEAEADPGPDERIGRRGVGDFGFIWPVLGPRRCRIGATGDSGQGGEDEKIPSLVRLFRTQAIGRRPPGREVSSGKIFCYFGAERGDRGGKFSRQRDFAPCQVDSLELTAHRIANGGALLRRESIEVLRKFCLGDIVFGQTSQPLQCEGGVVVAEIRAHAIKAAVVHQVGLLEPRFTCKDVRTCHHGGAGWIGEPFR